MSISYRQPTDKQRAQGIYLRVYVGGKAVGSIKSVRSGGYTYKPDGSSISEGCFATVEAVKRLINGNAA